MTPSRGLETMLTHSPMTFSTEAPGHTSQAPGQLVRGSLMLSRPAPTGELRFLSPKAARTALRLL